MMRLIDNHWHMEQLFQFGQNFISLSLSLSTFDMLAAIFYQDVILTRLSEVVSKCDFSMVLMSSKPAD
jgi:hypothetical protein